MSDRKYLQDVTRALVVYQDVAEELFGTRPEIQLIRGSRTNGETWKVYALQRTDVGPVHGSQTPPGFPDVHVGWTATEAYDTITLITGVLWSVVFHNSTRTPDTGAAE